MSAQSSAERVRFAKLKLVAYDIYYQERYIAGLQNADLFSSAYEGLRHLEKTLWHLMNEPVALAPLISGEEQVVKAYDAAVGKTDAPTAEMMKRVKSQVAAVLSGDASL